MKLGYPCLNWSIGLAANKTFRLASYSESRLCETISNNLSALEKILNWNIAHGFFFFRISSELIPFASHPVNKFDWLSYFKADFERIGKYIHAHQIRISMHPDQFVLINTPSQDILKRSIADLKYHADVLAALNLDDTAKIQIHVGGVYGDKPAAINRFIENYNKLDFHIKRRLVIENDDRLFSLKDCLFIREKINIPIIFDNFHHECLNNGENLSEAMSSVIKTWSKKDGIPMVDFSHQQPSERRGKHAQSIDPETFKSFLKETKQFDFDVMLEIKDKEASAKKVLPLIIER